MADNNQCNLKDKNKKKKKEEDRHGELVSQRITRANENQRANLNFRKIYLFIRLLKRRKEDICAAQFKARCLFVIVPFGYVIVTAGDIFRFLVSSR